jgi:hypothetical protein
MPVHCHSSSPIATTSKSRKSNGFSIDDIIKNDEPPKTFPPNRSSFTLSPIAWTPPLTSIYQYQRESLLHYLRHSNQFMSMIFLLIFLIKRLIVFFIDADATTTFILNSYRKPKRNRTAFTPTQLLKLENAFEKNHYIVGQERKDLARHLNLAETKVKVWYQNRRTKHKRSINEDENSSTNEIDHRNESETSDISIKNDDEHVWNNEDRDYCFHLNENHSRDNHRQQRSCSN